MNGTLNQHGAFPYRATTLGAGSTLARIVRLLREAQGSRAPVQRIADRISAVFVPTVLGIAVVTFFFGEASPHTFHAGARSRSNGFSDRPPGLAVPTAVMIATGWETNFGILIKGGEALQRMEKVDTVVLDKTGTITAGHPQVVDVVLVSQSNQSSSFVAENRVILIVAALEQVSEHPLANAVVRYAQERGLKLPEPEQFESQAGLGVVGIVDGHTTLVGNQQLMERYSVSTHALQSVATRFADEGKLHFGLQSTVDWLESSPWPTR